MKKRNDKNGNTIIIGNNVSGVENIITNINGMHNKIIVGNDVAIKDKLQIDIISNDSELVIGDKTTFESTIISLFESSNHVVIGKDCMFAPNTKIYSSDFHSIISLRNGKRTNGTRGVILNDHVWICNDALILKGANIGSNSIIGAKSVVNRFYKPNSIIFGVPGKIVKRNVTWSRYLYETSNDNINKNMSIVENNDIQYFVENKVSKNNNLLEGWAVLKDFTTPESNFFAEITYKNGKRETIKVNKGESGDIANAFKNKKYLKSRFSIVLKKYKRISKINIIINNNDTCFYKEIAGFKEEC